MKERGVQGGNVHSTARKSSRTNEALSFTGDDSRCFCFRLEFNFHLETKCDDQAQNGCV